MKNLSLIILLFLTNLSFSQDVIKVRKDIVEPILVGIYKPMPEYPGGEKELFKFLSTQFKYPDSAKNNRITGKVYLMFTIDTTGKVIDVKVIKGLGYGCDKEAVRIIKRMPNWIPAKQNGKAIRVRMGLPIIFNLR